jgi:hypothetical protein
VRVFEGRRQPFLAEEDEEIYCQQAVNRVLEKLVQDSAIDFQAAAPPTASPVRGPWAINLTEFG